MESLQASQLQCYSSLVSSAVSEAISSVYQCTQEASAECKETTVERTMDTSIQQMSKSSILERRSVKSHTRRSLGNFRPSASLDEFSPPPSASFTIHRPSWVAMEDIEIGATIRRKKKARKSLSREISIEGTVVIQEEAVVYDLSEQLDTSDVKKVDTETPQVAEEEQESQEQQEQEQQLQDDTQVVPQE